MKRLLKVSLQQFIQYRNNYPKGLFYLYSLQWLLGLPVAFFLYYKIVDIAGMQGFLRGPITQWLNSPSIVIIVTLLAFGACCAYQYTLNYYFISAHLQTTKPTTIFAALRLKKRRFYLLPAGLMTAGLLLIMPYAPFGIGPTLLRSSGFMTPFTTKVGVVVWFILIGLILYLSLRLLFSAYYYMADDTTFAQALRHSLYVSRTKLTQSIAILIGALLAYLLTLTLVTIIVSVPLIIMEAIMQSGLPIVAGITVSVIGFSFFWITAYAQIVVAQLIMQLAVYTGPAPKVKACKKQKHTSILIGMVSLVVLCAIVSSYVLANSIYEPTTKIVAHRGYSQKALENTIPAMQEATKAGANLVELDIQQTKDGKFVVYHDESLKRLAKDKQKIYKTTAQDITGTAIQKKELKGEIPSFEAYLKAAKTSKSYLLVEIKVHGHEKEGYVKDIVALLKEYGVANDYIVQSLDKQAIEDVKKADPTIKTSYLVKDEEKDMYGITAEFLGVKEKYVDETLQKKSHDAHKGVMVWTVEGEKDLKKFIEHDVYAVITNEVAKAVELRDDHNKTKGIIERLWLIRQRL
ncbi:hypothetical protein CH76_03365 [Lysinibacillus sp. BF-4]|uniref:glycerophosphodiester phosphodiesterase family protein n=1 Tax=Lysinibacillus sp. BF-4 TaxID=1473546 RepID=UPI00050806F0|nr:glycerophosphodiester phosphodiesterase family protein [Lysinibacillus sp. BF-4]KFL44006.1 hypothetical protein CH76_03365 [Lysinibacillus sp. BF-4]